MTLIPLKKTGSKQTAQFNGHPKRCQKFKDVLPKLKKIVTIFKQSLGRNIMLKRSWPSYWILLCFATFFIFRSSTSFAIGQDLVGRLGVGMTQTFANNLSALSFKMLTSPSLGFGAMLGIKDSDAEKSLGVGIKGYKIIFDEPLLQFYGAGMIAMLSKKTPNKTLSGQQVDLTLGTEFHFAGLESLGFSVEFGLSFHNLEDSLTIETVGHHFLQGGIHFYL
jgi:hypothetical protein